MPQTRPSPAKKSSPKGGKGIHKNIGGFPVWVWGAGLVLALGVGLYLRSRSKGGSAATPQPVATDPTSPIVGTPGTPGTTTPTPEFGDNGFQQAIDALKGQVTDMTDFLNNAKLGSSTSTTFAQDGLTSPGKVSRQHDAPTHTGRFFTRSKKAFVKARPNTSAGRGSHPKPLAPKVHLPVTHHATHVAPQPRGAQKTKGKTTAKAKAKTQNRSRGGSVKTR